MSVSKSSQKRSRDGGSKGDFGNSTKKSKFSFDQKKNTEANNELPREIKVYKFAESRGSEINALLKNVHQIGGSRVLFQKLPRHMRRRAMSHNIKRLPRRARETAEIEYKNRPDTRAKKPSRKHRRRPRNLLSDYYRRQRRVKWLETHIWHAKRFHMIEKWGYKLPWRPTDRSYRACYRATANHCLLQDLSYECCIEVCGKEDDIIETFTHLLTVQTGSTVGGAAVIKGNRLGENILYSFDQYPNKAIGHISFLWRPVVIAEKCCQRSLWIWTHPSIFNAAWTEITQAFNSRTLDLEVKTIERPENSPFDKQVQIGDTLVTSLKDNLVKFRLIGPLSQTILIDTLKPATINCQTGDLWWQKYYLNNEQQHTNQIAQWEELKSCQSPAEAPPKMVLSLTVRDPRIFLPEIKTKLKPALEGLRTMDTKAVVINPDVACSPLWNQEIRQEVKSTKISEAELNKMRSNLVVPGSKLKLGDSESRIPAILIQRPGIRESNTGRMGYGSGWDVIVPSGWGMAFHLAFVYRGGRTGGLQEAESLSAEMGHVHAPLGFPDTLAGETEENKMATELLAKHKRYPPDKKPNFTKLGTPSPFSCPWNGLVEAWCSYFQNNELLKLPVSDNLHVNVLRNKKQLRSVSKLLDDQTKASKNKVSYDKLLEEVKTLVQTNPYCLVPVRVEVKTRGIPVRCACICIPAVNDLEELAKNSQYGGPRETAHKDPNKEKSKVQPVKKKKVEFIPSNKVNLDLNDRKIIGFVNSGRFVFGQGQGSGIAFCSLIGLFELFHDLSNGQKLSVLVRNPTSLQYRFASLSVLV